MMLTMVSLPSPRIAVPPAPPPHVDRTARHSSTKEHVEDLLGRHVGLEAVRGVVILVEAVMVTAPAPGWLLVSAQVVLTLLLSVGQDGVGVPDDFEGLRGSGGFVLVWMESEGEFSVGFF